MKREETRKGAPPESGGPCPCGRGRPYGGCCEPLLRGDRPAGTARDLMRSRFTAHALGDEAYLHRTYLPTAAKPFGGRKSTAPRLNWTRLVIHGDGAGPTPESAWVEFSAFYQDRDGEHEMRERSEFRLVAGQWLYVGPLRA